MKLTQYLTITLLKTLICTLTLGSVGCTSLTPSYKNPKTQQVVSLVEAASLLIAKEGEKAFPEFRKQKSKWRHGDTYIFVWDMDGVRHVYPPDPESEGQNVRSLRDINGKPIGELFLRSVAPPATSAWVHYQWVKPKDKIPAWKSTFLKRAQSPSSKKSYIIGCGVYDCPPETGFVVDLVDRASILLAQKGTDALTAFRNPASEYISGNTFLFILDQSGTAIFYFESPDLVGQNLTKIQDFDGQFYYQEFIDQTTDNDTAWVSYSWPKPRSSVPTNYKAYIRKVQCNGETYLVGAKIAQE